MSGLLALLDDVAAIAKLASTQLDDIAAYATKAGSKAAGVVIDDSAVTPKYVHGLPAARELPIVAKIARGSLFNKLVILLPAALLLTAFAPWALIPLLMLGGAYLCFEGAEKVVHLFGAHDEKAPEPETIDQAHLEKERVAGAIKTDFILSAEIMTIALSAIDVKNIWIQGAVLVVVAIGITVLVYGSVAILVKADDVGLRLAQDARFGVTRALGRGIVAAMPSVMAFISMVGTVAMLWVGGSIVVHGLEAFGVNQPGHFIHDIAAAASQAVTMANGLVEWVVKAGLDGVFGLVVGLMVIPVAAYVIAPVAGMFSKPKAV